MKINEAIKIKGGYNIKVLDHKTQQIIHEENVNNVITNIALAEFAKAIYDSSNNTEIKYLALGTGNSTASATNTTLESEIFRTDPISTTVSGVGQIQNVFYVRDNEAQDVIKEVGIFAGSTATTVSDTGLLYSRINWNFNKSVSAVEIQFTRTDTFQNA
jgi:hypothetical protein